MKHIILIASLLAACSTPPETETTQQALSAPTAATGHYDAKLVWFSADSAWVQSLLPPQLEVAPTGLTIPGRHPVAILNQHYVDLLGNPGWNELSLYVVGLRLKGGKVDCMTGTNGPFSYLPVMHVDSNIAIAIGNPTYGLNQHIATITRDAHNFDVVSGDPTAPLTYDSHFSDELPIFATGTAHLGPLEALLSAPVIGNSTGTIIEHQTDWMFNDPASVITAIPLSTVSAASPQLGSSFNLVDLGVNAYKLGGFHVVAPFANTIPVSCPSL